MLAKLKSIRIKTKLIIIIFIMYTILSILEINNRNMVYEAYDKEIYNVTVHMLRVYVGYIEELVCGIDELTLSIVGNDTIQENLKLIKKNENMVRLALAKDLTDSMAALSREASYLDGIGLWTEDAEVGNLMLSLKDEDVKYFVEEARKKEGSLVLLPYGEDFVAVRQIRKKENLLLDELGVLILKVDFAKMITSVSIQNKYIELEPAVAIYANDIQVYAVAEDNYRAHDKDYQLVDGKLIVRCSTKKLGWHFYASVPYSAVRESIDIANRRSIMNTVGVATIVIIITSIIIYKMLRHFNILIEKFEDFKEGKLPDEKMTNRYKGRTDEIGMLHNGFDKMAQEYEALTAKNYQSMLLLKDAEFDRLQKQIQPHFLFNTLSTIAGTAYENDDTETAKIVEALGNMLRYTIHNETKLTCVKQEVKLVEDYMYIQKCRYEDRLSFEVDLPIEIMDVEIPSFTIQPIVENAIVHVVDVTLEPCKIRLRGRIQESVVEIYVEDSGNCIREDILLKQEREDTGGRRNRVALKNIDSRIKLLFSEEYGLDVARINGYSRVTVKLPNNMRV